MRRDRLPSLGRAALRVEVGCGSVLSIERGVAMDEIVEQLMRGLLAETHRRKKPFYGFLASGLRIVGCEGAGMGTRPMGLVG